MTLLKRLEALETTKAAVRARAPKNDAETARLTFQYLCDLRRKHPELVPPSDAYWPCAHDSQDDIPLENLAVLARVDRVAAIVLAAAQRRDAHELM